jgi:hypothetical protein
VVNNSEILCKIYNQSKRHSSWAGFILFVILNACVVAVSSDEVKYKVDNAQLPKEQEEVIRHFLKYADEGVIYAFSDPDSVAVSRLRKNYILDEQSIFRLDMTFYNLSATSSDYYILCLVDYRSVPCNVSKKNQLLIKVSYEPRKKYRKRFSLPIFKKGRHDVTILGINISSFPEKSIPDNNILYRATVVVSEDYSPRLKYISKKDFTKDSKEADLLDYKNSSGLSISKKQYGEKNNFYYARIVNSLDVPMQYVVTVITIGKNSAGETFVDTRSSYVRADSMSEARFNIASENGLRDSITFFIAVENPYIKLETPPGKINQKNSMVLVSNIVKN